MQLDPLQVPSTPVPRLSRVDDHRLHIGHTLDQRHPLLGPEDEHAFRDRVGEDRASATIVTLRQSRAGWPVDGSRMW